MRKTARDNLSKFFYDGGKITLAVLVVGVIARRPFILSDLVSGAAVTLILVSIGVIIDFVPVKEE